MTLMSILKEYCEVNINLKKNRKKRNVSLAFGFSTRSLS